MHLMLETNLGVSEHSKSKLITKLQIFLHEFRRFLCKDILNFRENIIFILDIKDIKIIDN